MNIRNLISISIFLCISKSSISQGNFVFYTSTCEPKETPAIKTQELLQLYCGNNSIWHLDDQRTFYVFSEGTFCGMIIDTSKTNCSAAIQWVNELPESEFRLYANFDFLKINAARMGQIEVGWTDYQVSMIWGGRTKVIYHIENKLAAEYGEGRTVVFENGIVQSFIDLK